MLLKIPLNIDMLSKGRNDMALYQEITTIERAIMILKNRKYNWFLANYIDSINLFATAFTAYFFTFFETILSLSLLLIDRLLFLLFAVTRTLFLFISMIKFVIFYVSLYFIKRDGQSSPKSIYHIKPLIDVGCNGLMRQTHRKFASFVSFLPQSLFCNKEIIIVPMFTRLYNVSGAWSNINSRGGV